MDIMKKIGRNDPCPCGSGKKYKHCCLGITDDHKGMNQARNHKDEVEELLSNREFDSLEELQIFVDSFTEKKTRFPRSISLGFPPNRSIGCCITRWNPSKIWSGSTET